ncbi:hypothetical protein E2E30_04940 [Sphingomonas sp. AAP5]|uniref:hypothetical protein n=1 Tax=Sphingomonas sp. AAP5 TaxID=1523415 RepID=UPI001057415C|nr:hypothetical protein [Sphingomonas sp. AAP5]QBM75176.1 hypothetical protein E2E30_04940 [Sphingomonas sp. AAP5]
MKRIILAAAAVAALSSSAFAQSGHPGSHNPAIKDSDVGHVATPASGSNSFTEAQARGRIAKAGYAGVSKLAKDRDGVWRGVAMRHGKRVQVGLDYKGNVTTR